MGEPALAIPTNDAIEGYRLLRARAAALKTPCFWPALPGRPRLTALERAGLLRLAGAIPGACGEAKMAALMEAMRHAPPGDVVEIGSGSGRSAALLACLAGRYGVGPVLCVDRWRDESATGEADEALQIFEINLAPLAQGRLNYLRAPSSQAAGLYGPGLEVHSEAFGETRYQGRIALLNIEGDPVEWKSWISKVEPGGWIVVDCDGVPGPAARHAVEGLLARQEEGVGARFEAGGAMFLQLRR
jgi:hypothetical protein